jgi:hypothetical protein
MILFQYKRFVISLYLLIILVWAPLVVAEPDANTIDDPLAVKNGWHIGRPASEVIIHEFLTKAGCKPKFLMSYIYDPSTQKWWSKAEITAKFPEITSALTSEPCDFQGTPAQIAETLGLQWPLEPGPVLLFFAPLYTENDEKKDITQIFPPWLMDMYLSRLAVLDQFNALPKYKIVTPFQAELRRPAK